MVASITGVRASNNATVTKSTGTAVRAIQRQLFFRIRRLMRNDFNPSRRHLHSYQRSGRFSGSSKSSRDIIHLSSREICNFFSELQVMSRARMREVIPAFPFKNLSKIPKGHQDNSLARRNQNELRSGV